MEEEIWKDIPGYEGLYQASSITECCKGKRKTIGGYKWRYKDE